MTSCTFIDFMQVLKPWLNSDFIRQAHLDDNGKFVLVFVDGGQKVYQVDDCTAAQLKDTIELMEENGISVSRASDDFKKTPT